MAKAGKEFSFDAAAWLADTRTLPLAQRGLWIDLLCLMRAGKPRGTLTHPSGVAMTAEDVARALGDPVEVVQELMADLVRRGVASFDGTVMFSRRMVRDKRSRTRTALPEANEAVARIANALAEAIRFHFPKLASDPACWTAELDKLLRLDKRDEADALAIIAWLRDGTDREAEFWRGNILSGGKFRKQFPMLMVRWTTSGRSRGNGRRQPPSAASEFKGGRVDL